MYTFPRIGTGRPACLHVLACHGWRFGGAQSGKTTALGVVIPHIPNNFSRVYILLGDRCQGQLAHSGGRSTTKPLVVATNNLAVD